MYSFQSRIRYSEIDQNKQLDLASIINYFQDCSTFHSESIGQGLDVLEERNRVWVLNSWQIVVDRFPKLFETITISTWPYDFSGMYGYRNFQITDEDGNYCAYANSIWVNMDTKTNRPAKLTEEDCKNYTTSERLNMNYAPRKITVPKELTELDSFRVIKSNLDTNNHVNNGQYIKMAEEYLPKHFKIKQMRAEYRMSALLGDMIIPKISSNENLYTVVLESVEGKPYAVIEFEGEK